MTWHYDISDDNSEMDVYDHNGELAGTIVNDGGGFAIPGDIHRVMKESFTEGQMSIYNQNITRDAATNDIQEGPP